MLSWINLSLKHSIKVICIIWMFRGESRHFILNEYWWKLSQFIMVFFLKIYQLFFLFFITFIRWRNLSLNLSLKVICRIWMFRVDGKHFILNESWWNFSQFITVFLLELYQFFFWFFKTLIKWINLRFAFSFKVFLCDHV